MQNDYTFKNKASLLTEIQRHTRHGGGLSVRTLKESWKEAPQAIEELEKEGDVLVTRTVKDGQMRLVFWNEVRPDEASGGMPVEQGVFRDVSSRIDRCDVSLQSSRIFGVHSLFRMTLIFSSLLHLVRHELPFLHSYCPSSFLFRRVTGHSSRTRCAEASPRQEKGQEVRPPAAPVSHHERPSQG